MNLDWKKVGVWAGGVVVIILVLFALFTFFGSSSPQTQNTGGSFGTAGNQTTGGGGSQNTTGGGVQTINTAPGDRQSIFKIADGPVAGATFIQTFAPTTTIARYVMQDNGHVFDLPVDSPGAIARAASNTTIPGIQHTVWLAPGNGVILQYADSGTIKSVYLGFPAASSTGSAASSHPGQATQIQFLPDNIRGLAGSPDGKSVAYFLASQGGATGYLAKADGTNSKKLFSLPLSQLLLSWPAQNTLLLATKSAAGAPGMAFSVDIKTGGVVPILYGLGLTAMADPSFSTVLYQISDGATRTSYLHDVRSGFDKTLSINPPPERCVNSPIDNYIICAVPPQLVAANYLDLWHQGLANAADALFALVPQTGSAIPIATPGSNDGGVSTNIEGLSVSPDDHYLLYISRGDRSLWGVRLTQ